MRLFLFARVLEVGISTLNAHLNALQEAGAHPLRVVCWHFTHVLLDAETQLLLAAGLVAGSSCQISDLNPLDYWLCEACKASVYPNKPDSLKELHLSVEQCVREGNTSWMDTFP